MNQNNRALGIKRKIIKREYGQCNQTFQLFEQIIDIVNKKILSTRPSKKSEGKTSRKVLKPLPQLPTIIVSPKIVKKISQEIDNEMRNNRIILKKQRDWQGLLSERKEDIFGEYAVCFAYEVQSQNSIEQQEENGPEVNQPQMT